MFFSAKRAGRSRFARFATLMATLLAVGLTVTAAEARRLALIVGNSHYTFVPELKNADNDASDLAAALQKLDFDVTLLVDPTTPEFYAALDKMGKDAQTAESTLFFYSGHAFQMTGINYLVPVDAKLESRDAIMTETWSLDGIIARLQNRNRQTLIFLDACRNNPLPPGVRGSAVAADGLARLQTGIGTFVAFATEPGAVTFDGLDDARNSPFTAALLNNINTPGLSVSDLMIQVRNEVEQKTLRRQTPWDQSSLRSQFYFKAPEEKKQDLSKTDYELLAQLAPEDRKKFLKLLADSGFSKKSLDEAEAQIEVAALNLPEVEDTSTVIGGSAPAAGDNTAKPDEGTAVPQFELAEGSTSIGPAAEAPPTAPEPTQPTPSQGAIIVASNDPSTRTQPTPGQTAPAVSNGESAAAVSTGESATAVATGETAPTASSAEAAAIAAAVVPPAENSRPDAPIRLAALTSAETRNVKPREFDAPRIEGAEVSADTPEGRDILAAIDPTLLEPPAPEPSIDLASGVQSELKRLGCYQMSIDGSFGKGSKTALASYFLAKHQIPDTLDPTQAVYDQLRAETEVVCKTRVATFRPSADAPVAPDKGKVSNKNPLGLTKQQQKQNIEKALIKGLGTF